MRIAQRSWLLAEDCIFVEWHVYRKMKRSGVGISWCSIRRCHNYMLGRGFQSTVLQYQSNVLQYALRAVLSTHTTVSRVSFPSTALTLIILPSVFYAAYFEILVF